MVEGGIKIAKLTARWIFAVALGLDLLLAGIIFGIPGMSLSAHFARARQEGSAVGTFAANLTDGIFALAGVKNHCLGALLAYKAREQVAPWRG